jgi:hypothetical protein
MHESRISATSIGMDLTAPKAPSMPARVNTGGGAGEQTVLTGEKSGGPSAETGTTDLAGPSLSPRTAALRIRNIRPVSRREVNDSGAAAKAAPAAPILRTPVRTA